MLRNVLVAVTAIAAVSGCAWKSGALQLGPDTYQVSANASPARGGETGARKMAIEQANEHCATLGRTIEVTDIESQYAWPTNRSVTVTFLCVSR